MKCSLPGQKTDFLFDEQVRIVSALNPEEAYMKAIQLGRNVESTYKNSGGEMVYWTFEGLHDLEEIDSLLDGAEISSKRFRSNNIDNLVVPKSKLSIFWLENNKDSTAEDILN